MRRRQFVQLGEISRRTVADVFTCIVDNDGGDSCGGVRSLPDKIWGGSQNKYSSLLESICHIFLFACKKYGSVYIYKKTNISRKPIRHPLKSAPQFFLNLEETGQQCLQPIGFGNTTWFSTNTSGLTTIVDNNRDLPVWPMPLKTTNRLNVD